jgi:hypothetical protein
MAKPTDSPAAPVPPLPDVDPYKGSPLPGGFTVQTPAPPKPEFDATGRKLGR